MRVYIYMCDNNFVCTDRECASLRSSHVSYAVSVIDLHSYVLGNFVSYT